MTHKLRFTRQHAAIIGQEFRELYGTIAFADMAIALAAVFEPVILFQIIGLDIFQILLFVAAGYAVTALLMPFGAKLATRFGFVQALFLSIPFMVIYWILLFGSKFDFRLVYFAPLAIGIERAIFWPAFQAIVAYLSRKNTTHRGNDFLYNIMVLMQIVGPLLGGLVAEYASPSLVVMASAAIYLISLVPLFNADEIMIGKPYRFSETWNFYKKYPKRFLAHLATGEEAVVMTLWPIFIFVLLGSYFLTGFVAAVGSLLAFALLVGLNPIGRSYQKLILLKLGTFMYTLINIARIGVGGFYGIVMVDALGRSAKELIVMPYNDLTYKRASATDTLPYIVFSEQSAALGKCIFAVLAAIVFGLTGSLVAVFIVAAAATMLYMFS